MYFGGAYLKSCTATPLFAWQELANMADRRCIYVRADVTASCDVRLIQSLTATTCVQPGFSERRV